ncbi:hypothetical protein IOCL2690_000445300 [Leishmania lindenbergi]|uniref:Integral membrane protein n=1 Tax=Leishmania lindenbergi TaxID=651832 RepID=A0AAW3AEA5_9TRYP
MERRRGRVAANTVTVTMMAAVGEAIANTTHTSTPSSTESTVPPNSPMRTAEWTIDSAVLWLVTVFYFTVSATALAYFVARWRRRVYGTDRVLLRGGFRTDSSGAGANTNAVNEGLLSTISAVIERAASSTALAGAAAWQRSEIAQLLNASYSCGARHGGVGAASGGRRGRSWLGGFAPFLPGSRARSATAKRNKQKGDDGHGDSEALPTVWCEGAGGGGTNPGGAVGGSAVPSSSMGLTMTAREQQQRSED